MHITNLRKVGGSVMVTIPPVLLDILNLQAGEPVGLRIDGGQLVIQPHAAPKYHLADLLAQCDPNAPFSDDEKDWLNAPSLGNELL